jgi:hypothetical protein
MADIPKRRMDTAILVDARNEPTGIWTTAQKAVSRTVRALGIVGGAVDRHTDE